MNTAEDGLPFPQRYWAILTLVVGIVVSVLDSAMANIALPTIGREIGAPRAGPRLADFRRSASRRGARHRACGSCQDLAGGTAA